MIAISILLLFAFVVFAGLVMCFIEAPAIASIGVLAIAFIIWGNMNDDSEY